MFAMYFNSWIFVVWALVCLEISSVLAGDQYHIQTDEGPERYFRFQTNNGQFRKEKRLQDGTVIGTEAWIDAAGYLRLKDYIADKQGYRILKSKVVYVGEGTAIEDAMKLTKAVPAQTGVLVDGKRGLQNRANSIHASSENSNIYTAISNTISPLTVASVTTTTERPILGYLSPAEAAKLEPTPNLGFDHYPNELTEESERRQTPLVYLKHKDRYNNFYITTTEKPTIPLPSIEMKPPRENSRHRIRPIAIAPVNPQPVAADDLNKPTSSYVYSTPKPFEAVVMTKTTPHTGYYYGPAAYSQNDQPPQALPFDINALEDGLLPPLPPLYQRRRVPVKLSDYAPQIAPDYNDITVTRNGFHYVLPHQYHEEEQISDTKKAGSFGYVDPFGIRRVVYYNASPEKGFVHRNHNHYVGLEAQPYDEPQPASV